MAARQTTLLLLALGALLAVQPAAAQYGYSYGYGGSYGRRLLSIEDFKATGVNPLFNGASGSPVLPSRRSLLQYGGYSYGGGYGYGRRLLSSGSSSEDKTGFSRPGRSLLQYGGGYGYGYYG